MYTVQGIIILFIIPCAVYTQAKLCSRLVELSMERVSKPAALSLEQLQHQQRFAFCCFFLQFLLQQKVVWCFLTKPKDL